MKFNSITHTLLIFAITLLGATGISEAKTPRRATKKVHTTANTASGVKKSAEKHYGSYLSTATYTLKRGKSDLSIEYPTAGNPELVAALRNWIRDNVDNSYKGSLATPEDMMRQAVASATKERESLYVKSSISYISDNVVTIDVMGSIDAGGAHPMSYSSPATFLIANGEQLTTDILPPIAKIRPLLINGLMNYFEVSSQHDLLEYLLGVESLNDLNYGRPYITADGLNIIYGQYEIAPYAAGMPVAVIPFNRIKPLLTDNAMRFF